MSFSPRQCAGRFIDKNWSRLFSGNLLRITFFAGLILLVLTGGMFLCFRFVVGIHAGGEAETGFYRMLRDYDLSARNLSGAIAEAEKFSLALDKLEQKAETPEYRLSVLKRRRRLADLTPRCLEAYRLSARKAAEAFPWSSPIAAVAASALVHNAALSPAAVTELKSRLPLLNDAAFTPLRLSLHILAGDFKNPLAAVAAGTLTDITTANIPGLSFSEAQSIAADLALLKLLSADLNGANAEIQGIFYRADGLADTELPSEAFLRFAAEYHYDFGSILRSAELFSHLPGDDALLRQADALWLGAYTDGARLLWSMLNTAQGLYNLALTAPARDEAAAVFQRLVNLSGSQTAADSFQYGVIRYSRFLAAPQAIALLEGVVDTNSRVWPIVDLEKVKRQTEIQQAGRMAAETWLLLDRHPDSEDQYRWAAWYFDRQRNYSETAMVIKNAARHNLSGSWIGLHTAIGLIHSGDTDGAEAMLTPLFTAEKTNWSAAANLALIYEANRSPARALEYYEIAAAGVHDPVTASRIQLHIARCFTVLGRLQDARRVLEYALDLNPDNLNAQMELDRLEK